MLEYITLVRAFDSEIDSVIDDIHDGLIEEIKVQDIDATSGGALQKTISKPK